MGSLERYGHADLSAHGVKVYGVRALLRDARKVGVDVADLRDLTRRLGQPIARLAQIMAPKVTGRMAAGIRPAARADRVLVSVGSEKRLPYAARRHWGDPGTVGPIWLSRAEEIMRPRTIEKLGLGVMDLLRKHGF